MKPDNPLVSVIIPAFNCAGFITDTLESVYQQTYRNWEIVLIDDGSTDNTRSILAPHMNKILYVYQGNKGTAAARNTGIEKSRGELIAFLDNDDLWLADKLELQVRAIQSHRECGLVFADGKCFDRSGILRHSLLPQSVERWIAENTIDHMLAKGSLLEEFFVGNCIASASSVLVRKRRLDGIGLFDEKITIGDDYDLWLRIARFYPIVLLRSCLYMWRYRAESQSGPLECRRLRYMKSTIEVQEKHLGSIPRGIRATVCKRLSGMYWECGRMYFDKNSFRESRMMFSGCLRHNPWYIPALMYLLVSCCTNSFVDQVRSLKRRVSVGLRRLRSS